MVTFFTSKCEISIKGNNIVISNGDIIVNGNHVYKSDCETIKLEINGDPVNVQSDGSVNVTGSIKGNARVSGSLKCGDIGGNVNVSGSVHCGNISGSCSACGSVHRG